jgi:Na+/melibiose symporter-like transporter
MLGAFRVWERRREQLGAEPLVHFRLFRIPTLRGGLGMFLAQNLILMGIFFTVPLYLQVVQGFDAFQTGLRMLPVSVAMLITAAAASRLASRWPARPIVRVGLALLLVATLLLISTIDPNIDNTGFAIAMAILGVGFGLIVSQLGNVVQSSITDQDRGEAGGLQFTAQQLGAALGTALIGAVLITGLATAFQNKIADDPRISADVSKQVSIKLEGQVSFVTSDQVRTAATQAGVDQSTTSALVDSYEHAQLQALKTALLFAALIVVAAFWTTGNLPTRRFEELAADSGAG